MVEAIDEPGHLAPLLPGGGPVEKMLPKPQFFFSGKPGPGQGEVHRLGGRSAVVFWHERWRHDKEVRSTHGINFTGSFSWKAYVKGGVITRENQEIDYPAVGRDSPGYEPRGCPRWSRTKIPSASRVKSAAGRPRCHHEGRHVPPDPGTGGRRWRRIGRPY